MAQTVSVLRTKVLTCHHGSWLESTGSKVHLCCRKEAPIHAQITLERGTGVCVV